MIIDSLTNIEKYVSLNPLFQDVADYVRNNDLASMAEGKVNIKGEDLFANFVVTKGKTKEEAKLETHRKMIDIQIPLNVEETYGYTPLCKLPDLEYNEEKDIIKYEGRAESYVTCQPGEFAIFFPQDGHAPCISNQPEIKKAIFKIKA